MTLISDKTEPQQRFWQRSISREELQNNTMITVLCVVLILLTIAVTVIGYTARVDAVKSAHIFTDDTAYRITIATDTVTNVTTAQLSISLTNDGERDSGYVTVEVLTINITSGSASTYYTYLNKTWLDYGMIRMQQTKPGWLNISLGVIGSTSNFQFVLRVYEDGRHVSTYSKSQQVVVVVNQPGQGDVGRSRLYSEVPEFSDVAVPLAAIIAVFVFFNARKNKKGGGKDAGRKN